MAELIPPEESMSRTRLPVAINFLKYHLCLQKGMGGRRNNASPSLHHPFSQLILGYFIKRQCNHDPTLRCLLHPSKMPSPIPPQKEGGAFLTVLSASFIAYTRDTSYTRPVIALFSCPLS
jgi:hypothetical protein